MNRSTGAHVLEPVRPNDSTRAVAMERTCSCGTHAHGRDQCEACAAPRLERAAVVQRGPGRKIEAGPGTEKPDEDRKVENGGTGAKIGALGGALVGGILGGALGGSLTSTLLGIGIGALVGAGIGYLIGRAVGGPIRWSHGYAVTAAGGDSTTIERTFGVAYKAVADRAKNVWKLGVDAIEGGVDITVHTGGSRDPFVNPPTTAAEANAAVTDMKGYYARGQRGAWHTEAASKAHEEHHFREWKCASEHYWGPTKGALESITLPLASAANEGAAITAMRAGPGGADAKMVAFQAITRKYWVDLLSDKAGSRPYAAGQRVLNRAVRHVQDIARSKGWGVPAGTTDPNTEPPCYQPWLPYAP